MEQFVVQLNDAEEEIRKVVEPLIEAEGYELVRLSYKKAQSKGYLTLFVDTKAKENGITVENLTDISRLLSDVLDASFENSKTLHGRYELQVSSPGLDRPLTKRCHFESALGKKVKIRARGDGAGAKRILGALVKVTDDGIELSSEGDEISELNIKFVDMTEAHVVFEFGPPTKPGKKALGH